MPQLMPLSWIMSNLILLVILLVMVLIYSMSNYDVGKVSFACNEGNFFMKLWW